MRAIFTQSLRMQAVEKALSRSSETSLREVAAGLDIGKSTLSNWIAKAKNHELDSVSSNGILPLMFKQELASIVVEYCTVPVTHANLVAHEIYCRRIMRAA